VRRGAAQSRAVAQEVRAHPKMTFVIVSVEVLVMQPEQTAVIV
jgi:hypothetical protein